MEFTKQPQPASHHHAPQSSRKKAVSVPTFIMTLSLVLIVGFVLGTRSESVISVINQTLGTTFNSGAMLDLTQAQEAYRAISDHFDGDVDTSALQDGAAHGLTSGLGDPHTVYLNAEEAAAYEADLRGSLSGIGAEIGVRNDRPTILRVLTDSPAEGAGLQKGDGIVAVDSKSTADLDAAATATLIRGDEGTDVKLTIERDGTTLERTITRAQVTDPSVSSSMDGTTGIITIRRFDTDTGTEARTAARKLLKDGATSFILDLRDNGGGYLNQAQSVAGIWLSGKLVVTEKRGTVQTDELGSSGEAVLQGKPTVVLINGGSASASEVVAGALKDHKVATILGETSYGKGTVQQIFDLSGGNKIKITIAHWFTPSGETIEGEGITPDVSVELTADQMNESNDTQIKAALKRLQ